MSTIISADNYHHGDLRKTLITEARKIIETEGVAKVSLRKIATNIGVSQAAPYHHFEPKTALLAAVATQGFNQFNDLLIKRSKTAATPIDCLNKLGAAYVEYAVQNK